MAATISTGSNSAPDVFNVSSTSLEESGAILVAFERCPLCRCTRRKLSCSNCVAEGNFIHSERGPETFKSKLERWQTMKQTRLKTLQSFEKSIEKTVRVGKKKTDLQFQKEHLTVLKQAVQDAKSHLKKDQKSIKQINEDNSQRANKTKRHIEKVQRIQKYIAQIKQYVDSKESPLADVQFQLCSIRQTLINQLTEFIFPITEIKPKSETESMLMSTVSALEEARRTSYVRGRWVYTDNGGELQYMIVAPTLPGNGDYSAYTVWVSSNKDSPASPEGDIDKRNPTYTISAALCYTAQLVSVMAHLLDVNLPKRQCYSEFCNAEMSEKQFQNSVARLNHNILHLCFAQHTNPEQLHPRHSIHNLIMLMRSPDLGRGGSFRVSPELMQSIVDSSQSESEDEQTDIDNEAEMPRDWETVPTDIPEAEMSVCDTNMSNLQSQARGVGPGNPLVTQSMGGGLITSAAASVASLWRNVTGK